MANRPKSASRRAAESANHSDLEFNNSGRADGSRASNASGSGRGAANNGGEISEGDPATGSIIKGASTHDMSEGIVIPVPENINVSSKSDQKIVFRRYPCILWMAGSFIVGASIYLIYHLANGGKNTGLKEFNEG